jgi:hypothetical protein
MQVQAFVAHRSIEAFLLSVLPGFARLDIQGLHARVRQPVLESGRNELGAVIAAQIRGVSG